MKGKKSINSSVNGFSSVINASSTEELQWRKYNTPNGHGFAAEDANAINDLLFGKHVEKVGVLNELNGADRIVNGMSIQTKYCQSASKSINASFDSNGYFRYPGMKIEVPSDQFEEAVGLMAEKISNGRVQGVTDPQQASNMVIKGKVSYKQAVKIAKRGTIDSIKFDVKTQTVTVCLACGISFVLVYVIARRQGKNQHEALKLATSSAIKSGATAMIVGVVTQQMLRSSRKVIAENATRKTVDTICRTPVGGTAIRKLMSSVSRTPLTQGAARNSALNVFRTNVITGAVMTAATTVPDLISVGRGKMTWKQFGKNTAVNASGVSGGMSGAWVGAAAGSFLLPGAGTVIGGIVGSMSGGVAASYAAKKVVNLLLPDKVSSVKVTPQVV